MEREVRRAQDVSRMCIVCGRENPASLHAHFYELEDGEIVGVFAPLEEHQSYPGRLHGGIATAILDETIGRAINIHDTEAWGVTAELTTRFKKPVPLDGSVRCLARITRDTSRLFEGTGEIVLDDGTVAVEATGRYVKMPVERIAGEADIDYEVLPDEKQAPERIDI